MKLEKLFVLVAIGSVLVAAPITYALKDRTKQLKTERMQKHQIELRLDSVQKQLDAKQKTIEQKVNENADLQKKLESKLQSQSVVATVQAPKPAPVVVAAASVDCQGAKSLIDRYDWNTTVAYNVMVAESGCNANNANWTDGHPDMGCTGSFGLFQINCGHGQVFDAAQNVSIAYQMWRTSGWRPWSATTCRYKVACY